MRRPVLSFKPLPPEAEPFKFAPEPLGVTASIAAYKAADIASKLKKQDRSVHVVMTAGATQFVTPLTFADIVSSSRHPMLKNQCQDFMPSSHLDEIGVKGLPDHVPW